MFSIVKVARDQTKPGSLLARPRGRLDERPWERGWIPLIEEKLESLSHFRLSIPSCSKSTI